MIRFSHWQLEASKLYFSLTMFRYVTDGTAAIFVVLSMFMWPAELPDMCCMRGGCGKVKHKPREPFLTWNQLTSKVQWGLLMMIGGGFALADSITVSFEGFNLGFSRLCVRCFLCNIPK